MKGVLQWTHVDIWGRNGVETKFQKIHVESSQGGAQPVRSKPAVALAEPVAMQLPRAARRELCLGNAPLLDAREPTLVRGAASGTVGREHWSHVHEHSFTFAARKFFSEMNTLRTHGGRGRMFMSM